MNINKTIVISFFVGVLSCVLCFQVWTNWQFRKLYNIDHITLQQVVNFINSNVAAQPVEEKAAETK